MKKSKLYTFSKGRSSSKMSLKCPVCCFLVWSYEVAVGPNLLQKRSQLTYSVDLISVVENEEKFQNFNPEAPSKTKTSNENIYSFVV